MGGRIINIGFMLFAAIGIAFFTYIHLDINVDSFEAESEIFIHNILYSPNGISYYDGISGRLYPGTIDLSKLTNSTTALLQKSADFGADRHIGAKIIAYSSEGAPLTYAVYNPLTYQRIEERGISGIGGVDVKEKQIYVLIKDGNSFYPGKISMSVLIERSK
jgi:hypothetical protein